MARHRRMVAPINSVKHFIPRAAVEVGGGGILNIDIADATVAPATASNFDVKEGSIIKAVHCELWMTGKGVSGITTQFVLTVEKVPGNVADMTFGQSLALQGYPNKKNILYTTQGVVGTDNDGPVIPIIRDWVLIPKGKQRMGFADRIMLNFSTVTANVEVCGMFIYKEYT